MGKVNTIDVVFQDEDFKVYLTSNVYDKCVIEYNNIFQDVTDTDSFVKFLLDNTLSDDNTLARTKAYQLYEVFYKVWDDYKLLDEIDSTSVEIKSIDPITYIYNDNGVIIGSAEEAILSGTEHIYNKLHNINKGITEVTLNDATVGYDYHDISLSKDVTTDIIFSNRSYYFNIKGRPEQKNIWTIDLDRSFRIHKNTYKSITNLNLVNLIFPFFCQDMRSPTASLNHAILNIELEISEKSTNVTTTHTVYKKRVKQSDYQGTYYNLFLPLSKTLLKPKAFHTFKIYLEKDIQYPPYGIIEKRLIGKRSGFLSEKQYDTLVGYLDYNNIISVFLMFSTLQHSNRQIII